MTAIPKETIDAWASRNTPASLATCSPDGTPNNIYTLFVTIHDEDAFLIVDHYFNKTRENIESGSVGSLLFLSGDGRTSYQVKGSLEVHKGDEIHQEASKKIPPTLPNHAAVILRVEEVYAGAEKLT